MVVYFYFFAIYIIELALVLNIAEILLGGRWAKNQSRNQSMKGQITNIYIYIYEISKLLDSLDIKFARNVEFCWMKLKKGYFYSVTNHYVNTYQLYFDLYRYI